MSITKSACSLAVPKDWMTISRYLGKWNSHIAATCSPPTCSPSQNTVDRDPLGGLHWLIATQLILQTAVEATWESSSSWKKNVKQSTSILQATSSDGFHLFETIISSRFEDAWRFGGRGRLFELPQFLLCLWESKNALLLQAEFHYSGKKITFIYCGLALQLNDEDVIVIFEVQYRYRVDYYLSKRLGTNVPLT